jgi:hypothetical protein
MKNYPVQTVPVASAAALGSGAVTLKGLLLYGGSAASSVEFKNAATDTGTVLFSADVVANDSRFIDLTNLGGVPFSVGCFCKPAGTGAIVYAWYEDMS